MYLGIGLVLAVVALALYDRVLVRGLVADNTRIAITWRSVKLGVGAALRTWRGRLSGGIAALTVGVFQLYNAQIVIYRTDGAPRLPDGATSRISSNPPNSLVTFYWRPSENWLVILPFESAVMLFTLMALLGVVIALLAYQLGYGGKPNTETRGALAVPGSLVGMLGIVGCCGSVLIGLIASIAGVGVAVGLLRYSELFYVLGAVLLSTAIVYLAGDNTTCEWVD